MYKIELHETEGSKCEYSGPSLEEMKKDKSLDILNIFSEKDKSWRDRIITEFSELFTNIDEETVDIDIQTIDLNGESVLRPLSEIISNTDYSIG